MGSGTRAVKLAMEISPREMAVVGCGALGLTSAILAQNAGARVDDLRQGPDARHALGARHRHLVARFAHRARRQNGARLPRAWEEMARTSFHTYRRYLGLPGTPVEWLDNYYPL